MITGEPGTGKFIAAQTIHLAATSHDAPFIHVDCAGLAGHEARETLFGSATAEDFLGTASDSGRADGQEGGALCLADQGTLVLRHIGALEAESQEILSGFLEARAGGDEIGPQTRVIATTSEDLGSLVETGRFHGPEGPTKSAKP